MASAQTAKVLLHGTHTDGKTVHRWIVAAFANKSFAATYAAILKKAHESGDAAEVERLDPNCAKSTDGKPFSPIKLSVSNVPYNPHNSIGSGLDED
jgi:hypothetical protein